MIIFKDNRAASFPFIYLFIVLIFLVFSIKIDMFIKKIFLSEIG